jgi:sortase A
MERSEPRAVRRGTREFLARICWLAGALLVLVWVVARLDAAMESSRALAAFDAAAAAPGSGPSAVPPPGANAGRLPERLAVDFALWDPERIRQYEASFSRTLESPIAVLEIPKLALRVPVLNGTDELRLNRGVGRIAGTSWPGAGGNLAIAGHRDGFFRVLKDIALGDDLRIVTLDGPTVFTVRRLTVVEPADVHVLDETPIPTVTLVTCFPFDFVGSAPDRFVVQAERTGAEGD